MKFFYLFFVKMSKEHLNLHFDPSNPHFTPLGHEFCKFFLSGYLHRNRNLHSKFHVSSSNSFGSALIRQQLHFHPFRKCFEKNIVFSGYIHRNRNLHSKFYISNFSNFGSALIYQQPPFHHFR